MTKSHDMGNNESLATGIDENSDGTYTALTLSASKTFKTLKGATKWLAARGYKANGERA